MHPGWSVIVPVKRLDEAKSRFSDSYDTPALLAEAFLHDVLATVIRVPRVRRLIVTTSDPQAASIAREYGALIVDDSGHEGINAAAKNACSKRAPESAVAVLVSDLPWLTAQGLDAALELGESHDTCFVPDRDGTGTTLWMSCSPLTETSQFGSLSRAAHIRSGAVDVVVAHPQAAAALDPVRRDADDAQSLLTGHALPAGSHTAILLRRSPIENPAAP